MKRIPYFILISIFGLTLQGCPGFLEDGDFPELYPELEICKFKEGNEIYYDNAFIKSHNDPCPWKWLQKPYPMGDGYYMWTLSGRYFFPGSALFLSTTREEWNAGNQCVDDSLIVCEDPFEDDYIFIRRFQMDIVKDYITIIKDSSVSPPNNEYISWADTAWFRKNVIDAYVSNANHNVSL
ncbi:MAG: hypothetical protein IJP80_06535 [Bacteroidales bacterium]|nr:hypothetical protein [Bacteroidales bacterium]